MIFNCFDCVSDVEDFQLKDEDSLSKCSQVEMKKGLLISQTDSKQLLADYEVLRSDAERMEKELKIVMIRSEKIVSEKKNFFNKLDEFKKSTKEQVNMESVLIEARKFMKELCDYVNLREGFLILVERFSSALKKVSIDVNMFERKMKTSMSGLLDMEKTAQQQVEVEKLYSKYEESEKESCGLEKVRNAFIIFLLRFHVEMDRVWIRMKE